MCGQTDRQTLIFDFELKLMLARRFVRPVDILFIVVT